MDNSGQGSFSNNAESELMARLRPFVYHQLTSASKRINVAIVHVPQVTSAIAPFAILVA
jgi:hypothetical protein